MNGLTVLSLIIVAGFVILHFLAEWQHARESKKDGNPKS